MSKSDDLYIRVLKYCRDNVETPQTPFQIIEHLNSNYGYRFVGIHHHMELLEVITFTFGNKKLRDDIAFPMTGEAYFKLLEYEELSEARKNAREARTMSIIAIVIAVIVGAMELFVQVFN